MTGSRGITPLSVGDRRAVPPRNWVWRPLTSCARLESGHTPSRYRPEWWGGQIPWISLTDIRELDGKTAHETKEYTNKWGIANSAARVLPAGTVVLSRTASVGFVTTMGCEMATSQDFVNWVCGPDLDPRFLAYLFRASRAYLRSLSSGAIHQTIYMPTVEAFEVCLPDLKEQQRIVGSLDEQMAAVERARAAAEAQLEAARAFPEACIRESLRASPRQRLRLAECLREVSEGVGPSWSLYPVLGATRAGIAPAKDAVGKAPARYKLIDAGTIFYNPMRILLGSIAMVDEGDEAGITSPDYVVFKPKPGALHPRWFYYWLRGHEGAAFIRTLARGAVRERMLFRRLAEAEVEAPSWRSQVVAAEQMEGARAPVIRLEEQVIQIEALPAAVLRRAFSGAL